jgi:hypothetical protein
MNHLEICLIFLFGRCNHNHTHIGRHKKMLIQKIELKLLQKWNVAIGICKLI